MNDCSYSGIVQGLTESIRLDRYAAEILRLLSRSQIKSRCLEAKLNGKDVKISRLVKNGDELQLCWQPSVPLYLEPENIPLKKIYEDDRCVVINKEQGMVVHPGAGNYSGTLANALLWNHTTRYEQQHYRNGIVHRLDKDTSGVIIAAYDDEALAFLSAQFKAKTVRKRYLALVQGIPQNNKGAILTRLIRDPRDRKRFTAIPNEAGLTNKQAGKIALTRYRLLKSWPGYSLLLLEPRTGRTHQLRVHLKYLGNPIAGDPVYNPQCDGTLMLHALSLAIVIPGESKQRLFKAPMPTRFKEKIKELEKKDK